MRTRIKQCGAEIDRLLRVLTHEELSPAAFRRINEQISALEEERSTLSWAREDRAFVGDAQKEIERLVKCCSSIQRSAPLLSVQEKRTLMKLLAGKLLWDGSDLHIFRNGA